MASNITHVLFDMDGLLLETESMYTIAQDEICRRHGTTFTWELKAKMMGRKAIEAAGIFVKELGLEDVLTPEEVLTQREARLDELFPTAQLMPGVDRLIRHLHRHDIPIAVATSSPQRLYDLKTTNHTELFSLFNHIITGDAVSNGKPHPEIFLTASQRWSPAPLPENCLVFEDAPTGVAAAKAAGMRCVLVPDARLDQTQRDGADEVLESLELFDPVKYGLPAFDDDI